jgi:hypothetical protein
MKLKWLISYPSLLGLARTAPDFDVHEQRSRDMNSELKGVSPHSLRSHPVVRAMDTCADTVNRLKKGPANIPEVIEWGQRDSTY